MSIWSHSILIKKHQWRHPSDGEQTQYMLIAYRDRHLTLASATTTWLRWYHYGQPPGTITSTQPNEKQHFHGSPSLAHWRSISIAVSCKPQVFKCLNASLTSGWEAPRCKAILVVFLRTQPWRTTLSLSAAASSSKIHKRFTIHLEPAY